MAQSSENRPTELRESQFTDQTVLITGGAQGIGAACARAYASSGAAVVIADANLEAAQSLADEIGTRAIAVAGNVTSPEDCQQMVKAAMDAFGGLTIAVNCAGTGSKDKRDLAETDLDEWRRILDVNLTGLFLSLKAEIPAMIASGGGSIVNVASVLGVVGGTGNSSYVASKHGVVGLTKTAAIEYAPHGVRVNAIGPGYTETRQMAALSQERRAEITGLHPMGRFARPEEIARAVVLLTDPANSFMTGAYVPVDGGYVAR